MAAIEGLGQLHAQLQAQGGHLLYSTPDFARRLADTGYDVTAVKGSSRRHPGTAIVAVKPTGGTLPGMESGSIPASPSATRGGMFQAMPSPMGETHPGSAGGIFEPAYAID